MPADPADIGPAIRDSVKATWSDATIAARYPSSRDGSTTPAVGYFDSVADAQTVINARGALIGTERRRFTATAMDEVWPDLSAGTPQAQLVDAEQSANLACLTARLELNLDDGTTTYELFG